MKKTAEEIYQKYEDEFCRSEITHLKPFAIKAMQEYGKQCFEAAREMNFISQIEGYEDVYPTYEDYLKSLEQ